MIKLYVVIPCYNEQEVLPVTSKALTEKFGQMISDGIISADSRVVFVDDGSKDRTWEYISQLHSENIMFDGCKLSRNRGHQNALLAGLSYAVDKADAIISMDADLQDDIHAMDKFIEKYNEGCEIVYGVRSSRKKDSFFKKHTALAYYKLLRMLGCEIVYNHADYRLMSNRAVKALFDFKEVNLFLRGIVPMVGFKSDKVYYVREERVAGKSKYPLGKMISFAVDGVTSLSIKPIRLITMLGLICFLVSIGMLIYSLVGYFTGATVSGWASLITSIWALGGLQLFSIGVIGEYIGKIYLETKQRPRFIIEESLEYEQK